MPPHHDSLQRVGSAQAPEKRGQISERRSTPRSSVTRQTDLSVATNYSKSDTSETKRGQTSEKRTFPNSHDEGRVNYRLQIINPGPT